MLRGGLCGRPEDPSDLDEIEPCGGSTRPETCCAAATTSTSQTSAPAGLPLPRARWPRRPSLARPRAPRMAPLRPRSTPGPRDGVSSRVTCGDATAFPGTRRPSDRAACRRRGVAPTIAHGDLHGPPGHGPARRNTAAARGRTTGAYVRRFGLGFIAPEFPRQNPNERANDENNDGMSTAVRALLSAKTTTAGNMTTFNNVEGGACASRTVQHTAPVSRSPCPVAGYPRVCSRPRRDKQQRPNARAAPGAAEHAGGLEARCDYLGMRGGTVVEHVLYCVWLGCDGCGVPGGLTRRVAGRGGERRKKSC